MTQPNLSLILTKDERSILLGALSTKTIETRGYLSSYDDVVNGPAPTDQCCQAHLRRFEERQDQRDALIERHATISELAQKVEDASPGIVLSVDELSGWAGRTLQTGEVDRLAAALKHSSVPEAIATIVASFEN